MAARSGPEPPPAGGAALIDALGARRGLVCFVGAGGKKTAMWRLAGAHSGRVALTSLTRTPAFSGIPEARLVFGAGEALHEGVIAAARRGRVVAYAGPMGAKQRHAGVSAAVIRALHGEAGFEATYIKADGARMRLVKGPLAGEPELPPGPAAVVPVASIRVVGRPLDDRVVHRPERFAEITGVAPGDPIEAMHLARLVAYQHADLARRTGVPVVPLLTMADDAARADVARRVAALARAIEGGPGRVAIACLLAREPLVDVV